MTQVLAIFRREFLIAIRSGIETANPVAFFLLASVVFSFGLGSSTEILREVGPVAIWLIALLASLLSLEGLYKRDYDDGSLATILLHTRNNPFVALARLFVHWSLTGLPVIVLTPLMALIYRIEMDSVAILMISLVVGTPIFTLIGGLVAALVVGLDRGGILLAILVLPLYVPVLLLGIGVCQLHAIGLSYTSEMLYLGALLALSLTVVPIATSPVLRSAYGG